MTLVSDWKRILRKAWSVRLILLAGLLSGVEVLLPFFNDRMPRGSFALASFVIANAALVARLVAQKGISND